MKEPGAGAGPPEPPPGPCSHARVGSQLQSTACATCSAAVLLGQTGQVVGAGAGDADARVRGQAMFALGELASHCQPDMGAHVGGALPHVFAAMAGDDPTLVQQACYALDCIVEHLGARAPAGSP